MRAFLRIFYIVPLFYLDELCQEYAAILRLNGSFKKFFCDAKLFAREAVCQFKSVAAERIKSYFILRKHAGLL